MDIVIGWVSKLVRPQWLGAYRFLWALGGGRWLRRWEEVKELVLSAELVADLTTQHQPPRARACIACLAEPATSSAARPTRTAAFGKGSRRILPSCAF